MSHNPFLTARWEHLAMLNYEIDPAILRPLVPPGTELDQWQGKTFVSMVGFMFLDTKVLGIPIPFHRNFEEVNLRFYVRRKDGDEWKRGVVFVKEIVPKVAIAAVARGVYGEKYVAYRMNHTIEPNGDDLTVRYGWKRYGTWHELGVVTTGEPRFADPDAEETFITEHYWGYASNRSGTASVEYEVAHPQWRVWQVRDAHFHCDVARIYGPQFVDALNGAPSSAFLADGSPVTVFQGRKIV